MNESQKKQIISALKTFGKACIPPLVAFISSVLTTLISGGSVGAGTAVGAATGIVTSLMGVLHT